MLPKLPFLACLLALCATHPMAAPTPAALVDESQAEALMKKSGCFKCHSITRRKDAPSYREIAVKYKGKADGETRLTKHITTAPVVKLDGSDEDHALIKSKDQGEIRNVVLWILSR